MVFATNDGDKEADDDDDDDDVQSIGRRPLSMVCSACQSALSLFSPALWRYCTGDVDR